VGPAAYFVPIFARKRCISEVALIDLCFRTQALRRKEKKGKEKKKKKKRLRW
jgi:hypothetical protein